MKPLILASLITGASLFVVLPLHAQTNNSVEAKAEVSKLQKLLNILSSATENTLPETLQVNLLEAIERVCINTERPDSRNIVLNDCCGPTETNNMVSAVVNTLGADNPLVRDFLTALSLYGVDPDAVTLFAISAGVDATTASEATAAGPGAVQPAPPPAFNLPTLPTPIGAGGTGGDSGISEAGN